METLPDKSNAARARRTLSGALLEESVIKLTAKVQNVIDALAALKPDDPGDTALIDKLDRLVRILSAMRDQVAARFWTERLAAAILRSPSLLANTPGSPSLRKIGGWAQKVSKESNIDGRTVAARNAKEAARALGALAVEKSEEA